MQNPLNPIIRDALDRQRKSLTPKQEKRFLKTLRKFPTQTAALCELLYWTGCRLSEALAVRREHLDTDECCVVLETLKQRSSTPRYRAVPIPPSLMRRLLSLGCGRLFPFSRWTARRRYKPVMTLARIFGRNATSRAFRHSFNKRNIRFGLPEPIRCSLTGHAKPASNFHYSQFVGEGLTDFVKFQWLEAA